LMDKISLAHMLPLVVVDSTVACHIRLT
jgi:hypothetical protein